MVTRGLVKKSYLDDKFLNPEYQVIASESVNTPPGLSVICHAFHILYQDQPTRKISL